MIKLLEKWRRYGAGLKILIIASLLTIIIFGVLCINTDWAEFLTKEEDYLALEEVAYNIIETKNVMQPLDDKLQNYKVFFNEDGSIDFTLWGNAEYISFEVSSDFEVKSFNRGSSIVFTETALALIFSFGIAAIIATILYCAIIRANKFYLFLKK